jgi:Ni,Fe-hydrogenase III large subunit
MLDVLERLERGVKQYIEICGSDPTILSRCMGVGVLSKQDALEVCAVGPVARAAGVDWDLSRDDPYLAYGDLEFDVVVERGGDVLAQILVRLREVLESIHILRQAVEQLPGGPIRAEAPGRIEPNEAVERTEAPRGELLYYIVSNGTDKPERVRVRTPTYANIMSWKRMFQGCTVAEIPIVLASIDPCMACNDRVVLVDSKSGKARVVTIEELRRWRA